MNKRPFWKEPMVWLIAGLPLTAVVASLASFWIATKNADQPVDEHFHKQGLAITQEPSHSPR